MLISHHWRNLLDWQEAGKIKFTEPQQNYFYYIQFSGLWNWVFNLCSHLSNIPKASSWLPETCTMVSHSTLFVSACFGWIQTGPAPFIFSMVGYLRDCVSADCWKSEVSFSGVNDKDKLIGHFFLCSLNHILPMKPQTVLSYILISEVNAVICRGWCRVIVAICSSFGNQCTTHIK